MNSDGWQIGLRADACAPFGFGCAESPLRFASVHSRSACCFARFSHQQMTNMFLSGIYDAENVV
jgi:hypothetical protein